MASTQGTTADQSEYTPQGFCCANGDRRGNWSCLNIAAMVLGFVIFWPIGLLILFGNIKGVSVKGLPGMVRQKWSTMKEGLHSDGSSGNNAVFNEFQQAQFDRIREIREEIKERSRRFTNFRERAKRRADEEEFNQFMAEAPVGNDS